jgi:hypothetical protein
MTTKYHLAQVNIARAVATLDSPLMQGFVDQLDHINRLAEAAPGFVWRLQTEEGDATAVKISDDDLTIVNLSVWESFESLKSYVYSGEHLTVLKNKKNWFEKSSSPTLALWWVPVGTLPSIEAALSALKLIKENGSTLEAFTFSRPFPAPSTNKIPSVQFA